LLVVTAIVTTLFFSLSDEIANWLYNVDVTESAYSSWDVTLDFRRLWSYLMFALISALTIYSWTLFFYKIGPHRAILAFVGLFGAILIIFATFTALLYSNRIV